MSASNEYDFWPCLNVIVDCVRKGRSLIVNVGAQPEIEYTLEFIDSVIDYFPKGRVSKHRLGNSILVSTGANIHVTAIEDRDLAVPGHYVLQTMLWRLMRGAISDAYMYENSKDKAPEEVDEDPDPYEPIRLEVADRPD